MNFKNFGISRPPAPPADGNGNTLLSGQPSIYSLTLDEFQSTMGGIGKDFGSMNMVELLKNIWSAEETQTRASTGSRCKDKGTNKLGYQLGSPGNRGGITGIEEQGLRNYLIQSGGGFRRTCHAMPDNQLTSNRIG
ncbi:hypothetical protein V6N13_048101 [Hibiscus sabdariffa]